jgi:hypothetical protein
MRSVAVPIGQVPCHHVFAVNGHKSIASDTANLGGDGEYSKSSDIIEVISRRRGKTTKLQIMCNDNHQISSKTAPRHRATRGRRSNLTPSLEVLESLRRKEAPNSTEQYTKCSCQAQGRWKIPPPPSSWWSSSIQASPSPKAQLFPGATACCLSFSVRTVDQPITGDALPALMRSHENSLAILDQELHHLVLPCRISHFPA